MRQPQWSIYEAAILLDGYLEVKEKSIPRLRIIKRISNELRHMATNADVKIDDIYRNENGISYQMQSMDSAYVGHKVYVPATKLFTAIVDMYRTDKQRFEKILKEANSMISPKKSNKEAFLMWFASNNSSGNVKWMEDNLKRVENFGNKAGIISGDLYDVFDVAVVDTLFRGITKSKVFQIVNKKLFKYIVQNLQSYRDYLCSRQKEMVTIIQDSGAHTLPSTDNASVYSSELLAVTETIITTCFVNGMRINASIAKKKFKSAYLELTGVELPESIDIDDLTASVGFEYSDKIYAVSEENKAHIRELISAAFQSGNHVIFYEEMYVQNEHFMSTAGIFSSDLLKTILKQMLPAFRYKRSCFSESDGDSLDTDIATCFEGKLILSYNDIKKMLPYADMGQIRFVCSRNSKFVWAKEETYALAEKLRLAEPDIVVANNTIADDIKKHGFSVIQRISAPISMDMNPEVPEIALIEAIYSLHIAPSYERKHSIITLPGASFSPSEVMSEYCKNLSEATLAELHEYEDELTSKTTYSLGAAYAEMIRVDKQRFVSRESVPVNVEAIDTALSLFVQNKIIPLISVNSFTSFPEIPGHTWNLYLLDSYCKHFSTQFCSMGGPAKSKPVGAIFPAQMRFDGYDDLLARVAAESAVPLDADVVSRYFTDNSYTLRKIDATGIATRAQQIRLQEE